MIQHCSEMLCIFTSLQRQFVGEMRYRSGYKCGAELSFLIRTVKICISAHTMNTCFVCFEKLGDTAYEEMRSKIQRYITE